MKHPASHPANHAVNHAAATFRTLLSAWHQDAADERVDALAAELAAAVAPSPAPLCLGLIHKEVVPRLFGLVFLLDGYGLLLRQRYRQQGDGVFVFLERRPEAAHEFAGATVLARRATPDTQTPDTQFVPLARAA
jgi:hypothetical protein